MLDCRELNTGVVRNALVSCAILISPLCRCTESVCRNYFLHSSLVRSRFDENAKFTLPEAGDKPWVSGAQARRVGSFGIYFLL
jgi:hypothetical protein